MCLQGRCLELRPARDRSCSKVECREGQVGFLGECLQAEPIYCEAGTCGKNEFCLSGACYEVRTRVLLDPAECEPDAVVWRDRCLRPISEHRVCPEACAEGEVCLDGGCFKPALGADACTDADCPSGWPCFGGICMKPNERQDWEPCEFCSADDCVLGFCTAPNP